jgi:hypothetical protein
MSIIIIAASGFYLLSHLFGGKAEPPKPKPKQARRTARRDVDIDLIAATWSDAE